MTREIELQKYHIQLIREECIKHSPDEACGVLIGSVESEKLIVRKVVPIKNSRPSNRSFELDPEEQYEAWDQAQREGLDIVGVYHTHPRSRASPSTWDMTTMEQYESVWIIAGTDGVFGYEWDNGIKPVKISLV